MEIVKMKDILKDAFTLLEKAGFSVEKVNESAEDNIVDVVKRKYAEWESMRNTPEGDDLWDELIDTYGNDTVDLVLDGYEDIKSGKPVDLSMQLSKSDDISQELINVLKKLGISVFKLNTKVAFNGNAYRLYRTMTDDRFTYIPPKSEIEATEYAYFGLK